VFFAKRPGGVDRGEAAAVRGDARTPELVRFFPSLLKLIVLVFHMVLGFRMTDYTDFPTEKSTAAGRPEAGGGGADPAHDDDDIPKPPPGPR
jgi:hypothetical protein